MNDPALVEGLRRHDPEAVRYLSETCLPSVWRFVCARLSGDRHLAEDIVSECVLALLKTVSDPAIEIGNVLSWLRSVASNKVADHFRAAARVQHLIDQVKQSMPQSDTTDAAEKHVQQEQREEVRRALDKLPEQTRTALEWKYIDKLSVREISQRMGITEKAAESILFRGRRDLRDRMEMLNKAELQPGCVCHRDRETSNGPPNEVDSVEPVYPRSLILDD